MDVNISLKFIVGVVLVNIFISCVDQTEIVDIEDEIEKNIEKANEIRGNKSQDDTLKEDIDFLIDQEKEKR